MKRPPEFTHAPSWFPPGYPTCGRCRIPVEYMAIVAGHSRGCAAAIEVRCHGSTEYVDIPDEVYSTGKAGTGRWLFAFQQPEPIRPEDDPQRAYSEGYTAGLRGMGLGRNPYYHNAQMRNEWFRGRMAGDKARLAREAPGVVITDDPAFYSDHQRAAYRAGWLAQKAGSGSSSAEYPAQTSMDSSTRTAIKLAYETGYQNAKAGMDLPEGWE